MAHNHYDSDSFMSNTSGSRTRDSSFGSSGSRRSSDNTTMSSTASDTNESIASSDSSNDETHDSMLDDDSIMSSGSASSNVSYYTAVEPRISPGDWTWQDLASADSVDGMESTCQDDTNLENLHDANKRHYFRWELARLVTLSASSTRDVDAIAQHVQSMLDKKKIDLSQDDATGLLPLHYALLVGASLVVIKILVEDYPQCLVKEESEPGLSAINIAATSNAHADTTRYLIERTLQYLQAPDCIDCSMKLIETCFLHHMHRPDVCCALLETFPEFTSRKSKFPDYYVQMNGKQLERNELPLHVATRSRAPSQVLQQLIELFPLALMQEGSDGRLPLHLLFACSHGGDEGTLDKDAIKLLATPLTVRARDVEGMLPLQMLCRDTRNWPLDMDIVRALVDPFPESVGKLDGNGVAPIHSVCSIASVEDLPVVCYMTELSPDSLQVTHGLEENPMTLACRAYQTTRDLSVVRFLAQNYPTCVTNGGCLCGNPLQRACGRRDFPLVECLVEASPDSMVKQDYNGRTPFFHLCERATDNDLPLVQFLTDTFPDLATMIDRKGKTPLDVLLEGRSNVEGIVRFLVIQHPELVEPRKDGKRTPLHNICANVQEDRLDQVGSYLKILSISERAVTAKSGKGKTPLHFLCANPVSASLLRTMVNVSPNLVGMTTKKGQLPLHFAVRVLVIAEEHLAQNAIHHENRRDQDNQDNGYNFYEPQATAIARVDRCFESVRYLLDQLPTAVTALDNNGVSPLILACQLDAGLDLIFELVMVNPVATLGIAGWAAPVDG